MCGRYTLHTEKEVLAHRFEVDPESLGELAARYNIAPTDDVLGVRLKEDRRIAMQMRWGLIPFWAKDGAQLPLMINARVETVATRQAYRDALREKRCLIPASGFFEWQSPGGLGRRKVPHWISRRDGEPFAMAGIWARWRSRTELVPRTVHSCAIITAPANAVVAELHDRMPVILPPEYEAAWIDPDLNDSVDELLKLLVPLAAEELRSHPVSTEVNGARNDGPSLIEPYEDPQLGFF